MAERQPKCKRTERAFRLTTLCLSVILLCLAVDLEAKEKCLISCLPDGAVQQCPFSGIHILCCFSKGVLDWLVSPHFPSSVNNHPTFSDY